MARLVETLNGAYSGNSIAPMLDLSLGGQHGWSPDLASWQNNQAYVSRPLTCVVLSFPRMFSVMPNPEKWKASVKSLFELHARSISGFNAGLKVDTDEHPVGGAGEMQQEIINVTRERSQPKFTFIEKYGRPIQALLDYWIRYGGMDPDSKVALLGTLNNADVTDLLAEWYTATCLFFVPDPAHRKIDKAWITANMAPLGTGEITAKRDLTTSQEMLTLDVDFTGISQYGVGVNMFAQKVLDGINIAGADPYRKSSFIQDISADVKALNVGYKESVNKAKR